MIIYTNANLFLSPAQTLVNTVNTVGVMGKGIAKDFKHYYPQMFRHYQRMCKEDKLTIGKLMISKGEPVIYRGKPTTKNRQRWVLNFPTKKHWRAGSKIEYLEAGLKKFVDTYHQHGIKSVSFPQLGVGNGGLNWKDVNELMSFYLDRLDIPVYIHIYHPNTDHYNDSSQSLIEKNLNVSNNEWRMSKYLQDAGFTTSKYVNVDGIVLPNSPAYFKAVHLANTKSFTFLNAKEELKTIWLQKNSSEHDKEPKFEQLSLL